MFVALNILPYSSIYALIKCNALKLKSSKDFIPHHQLQVNGDISWKSRIFQFQTEAVFRLGFSRQKKEFNPTSKESHSFLFLSCSPCLLLWCAHFDLTFPIFLVLTRFYWSGKRVEWKEVFLQIEKFISSNCKLYLSLKWNTTWPLQSGLNLGENELIGRKRSLSLTPCNMPLHQICPSSIPNPHEKV